MFWKLLVLLNVIWMELMVVMEQQIEALAEEFQPMLSEVRDSDLLKDVETIAKGLADASGDLRYYLPGWCSESYFPLMVAEWTIDIFFFCWCCPAGGSSRPCLPQRTQILLSSLFSPLYLHSRTSRFVLLIDTPSTFAVSVSWTEQVVDMPFTLVKIQSISSDISGFTGDETTRRNIKLLIKSLSRLLWLVVWRSGGIDVGRVERLAVLVTPEVGSEGIAN